MIKGLQFPLPNGWVVPECPECGLLMGIEKYNFTTSFGEFQGELTFFCGNWQEHAVDPRNPTIYITFREHGLEFSYRYYVPEAIGQW